MRRGILANRASLTDYQYRHQPPNSEVHVLPPDAPVRVSKENTTVND
jgi:hypothetical protein